MTEAYKTLGNFYESSEKFDLKFDIEREDPSNLYNFHAKYDISQEFTDPLGKDYRINGILIYIKKNVDPETPLSSAPSTFYCHQFPYHDLTDLEAYIPSNYNFRFTNQDTLVILFHETGLNRTDVDSFYNNLKDIYLSMKARGVEFDHISDLTKILGRPRAAGLTIIKRLP